MDIFIEDIDNFWSRNYLFYLLTIIFIIVIILICVEGEYMNVSHDYKKIKHVVNDIKTEHFSKVFFSSTDRLDELFDEISFENKSVLSVLSSADQLFYARYFGASKVDCFDKNVLTYYYYFLRRWTMKYKNRFYPDPILDNDFDWLRNLLLWVRTYSKKEKQALLFWKKILNNQDMISKMFIRGKKANSNSTLDNYSKLAFGDINFYVMNLFDKINLKNKYDLILISNILEWSFYDESRLKYARDNLYNLLDDDGLVVCSRVSYVPKSCEMIEREIFNDVFSYQDLGNMVGYTYRKK